ncbi:methyltransferase [Rhodobacteraceae bacterium ASV31]|nr:methyltransferase [Anianabacter salinae]
MLAAAVPAGTGARVLDLGCGVGAAMFCLGARVSGLALTGVEVQPEYAALARANAVRNDIPAEVALADIAALPPGLRQQGFDHVLMNPPYFQPSRGTEARDAGRAVAFGGEMPLAVWVDAAVRRLVAGGTLTVIQRVERLPELLAAFDTRLGAVRLLPLQAHPDRAPERVILHARKGSRAAFRMLPPLILHDRGGDSANDPFRPEIEAVQRDGAALPVDWC